MKEIQLTKDKFTLVDDADYEWLNQWKWQAQESKNGTWYASRRGPKPLGHKKIFMHRLIMEAPNDMLVDHKNRDGLDNCRKNLRVCTRLQNNHNRVKSKNGTSGYKGVTWNKKNQNYNAQIKTGSKHISLGGYADPADAAKAYDKAAKELHGEFANLNFPD